MQASRDYVRQVRADLTLDPLLSERVADYIVAELDRLGGAQARLVFPVHDPAGPLCSWCWAPGGMCAHIDGRAS